MSDPVFDVTYRVGIGNLNAFFGAWWKRTQFEGTNLGRLGLYAAFVATFLIWSIWHYVFGGKATVGFAAGYLLILGCLIFISSLVAASVVVFIAFPLLTYALQILTFAFGPMRKRTSHVRADPRGVNKTTGGVESHTKWRDFTGVVETKKTVLLFTNRNCAAIVPKSAFASPVEADAFAAFAKAQWNDAQSVF